MRPLTFNLDSDGVLYDFTTIFARLYELRTGRKVTAAPQEYKPTTEWDVSDEEFYQFMTDHAQTLFSAGDPYPGAIELVHGLVRAGHRVRVVTQKVFAADSEATRRAQVGTVNWYAEWGLLNLVELVFVASSRQKCGYPADVIADDKPTLEWCQRSSINVLVARSWNEEYTDPPPEMSVRRADLSYLSQWTESVKIAKL